MYLRCFLKGEMGVLVGIDNGKPNEKDQCFINETTGMVARVYTEQRRINEEWVDVKGIEIFHASKMTGSMLTVGLFVDSEEFSFDDIKKICTTKREKVVEKVEEVKEVKKIVKKTKKRRGKKK